MRHLQPRGLPLLGTTLWLCVGCASTSPTVASVPPAPIAPPAAPTPTSPWQRARVGDGATYAFAIQRTAPRGGAPRSLQGQVLLDVVAVQPSRLWVRVAFQDEAGHPLPQAGLEHELLLPMNTGTTRALDVSPAGEPSSESLTLAGRTWRARHFERDARASDGARVMRVYALEPEAPYLTHGLLSASHETESRAASSGLQLTLTAVREGSASHPPAPPTLERPLGPGTYYDRRVERGALTDLQRVCLAAERGFLLRTEGLQDAREAPCTDFSQATVGPLEEELLQLLQSGLARADVSATRASETPSPFAVQGQELPALTVRHVEEATGFQRITTERFAADPWDRALSGLALEARFAPLSETTERVSPNGQQTLEDSTRLVRWGTWLDGPR